MANVDEPAHDMPFRLRALADCGGCAAKSPPELVSLLIETAAATGLTNRNALVGLQPADDAVVYPLNDERALVASIDFFPPVVDDPNDYGTIAAANAVSDIYAMGADVVIALTVCGFPSVVPNSVVAEVNRAAAALVAACGGAVLGGHSIRCAEPVFGLCVIGFVNPRQIWRKSGALEGDVLVLSKPLGTGLLLSSQSHEYLPAAVQVMRETNHAAAAALRSHDCGPHAVTDVTGYGLLGHAGEMALQSGVDLVLETPLLPILPGAMAAAAAGVRTSAHRRDHLNLPSVDPTILTILQDPQTSGGLLAAVSNNMVADLETAGFVRIGVARAGSGRVHVQ